MRGSWPPVTEIENRVSATGALRWDLVLGPGLGLQPGSADGGRCYDASLCPSRPAPSATMPSKPLSPLHPRCRGAGTRVAGGRRCRASASALMGPTSPAALTLVLPDQQPHVIQTLLTQDILFWAVIKAKNPFS